MGKKLTKEEFVNKATAVHGSKYDYSLVVYKNNLTPVIVVCPIHGEFQQKPIHHLSGKGCNSCAKKIITGEEFLVKAAGLHKGLYDYSIVNYIDKTKKVEIICKTHGIFLQSPSNHLCGHGCPSCKNEKTSIRRKYTTNDFISRALNRHNGKYSYERVVYENSLSKILITCPLHGDFLQLPNLHLSGAGCPLCAHEELGARCRLSSEEFIAKAQNTHGFKYDYSLVEYKTSVTPVTIVCTEHGKFQQKPNAHLGGHGCPRCAKSGFNPNKDGFVYILRSSNLFKIGITNKSVKHRLYSINRGVSDPFESLFVRKVMGNYAPIIEARVLVWLRERLQQPKERFEGYTECFYIGDVTFPEIVDKILELEKELMINDNRQ